jgi:acyl-homoserine lactone acylase PvdQ
MRKLLLALLLPLYFYGQPTPAELSRWEKQAKNVTIIRDNYGVPHIYGKTDADAVFGLMYAQCEDDFRRVEMNYLEKLGKLSLVKGEEELYNDLLNAIVLDQDAAKTDYRTAPAWLRKLCDAFADGINYYIYKHHDPALVLHHFEPWYPMLWTDGSIGAINTAGVSSEDLKNLYGNPGDPFTLSQVDPDESLTGSNGFAFSPAITESHHAILYINPHVTFYFRPEVHMVSEEGLNTYGAVTWGQFFVYQGFNEHCGWMHTSSQVDAADSYIEKLRQQKGDWFYQYDGRSLKLQERKIQLAYKYGNNQAGNRTFTIYFTGHGPIMARKNGEYLSVRADNRLRNGLIQCWQRTKARSFEEFKATLSLLGNISNNTVYADAEGNIAYWHGNRVPVRDPHYDWSKPVDGTVSATAWKGYHSVNETVHLYNPPNGWLQNCNSTPFTVAGDNSPKQKDYPVYMAPDPENFRGLNAVRVLNEEKHYDLDKVILAGYDKRLTAFEILIPPLVKAFESSISYEDSLFALLVGPIEVLKHWDYKSGESSVATTLAVEWGQRIISSVYRTPASGETEGLVERARKFATMATPAQLIPPLLAVINDLQNKFKRWQVPWGEINRFQRLSGDIDSKFDDSKPSLPVGFTSSAWGMLPSYSSRTFPGTTRRYGVNGNSFICAVEFGPKVRARSLLAGGESGNPASPHFFDQGLMYSKGQFKEVWFYREDVVEHAEATYHPGE